MIEKCYRCQYKSDFTLSRICQCKH